MISTLDEVRPPSPAVPPGPAGIAATSFGPSETIEMAPNGLSAPPAGAAEPAPKSIFSAPNGLALPFRAPSVGSLAVSPSRFVSSVIVRLSFLLLPRVLTSL
jgi:hypothetical protein